MRFFSCLAVACAVVAGGCGGGGDPVEKGEALYREPMESGNSFACATCHALEEPAADGLVRPGHAIGDATRRPSYKNGRYDSMLAAVNTCVEHWMNADPLEEGGSEWKALHAFLDAQAPDGDAPALSYEIVDPPADLSGGDPAAGREFFNTACVVCHGEDASGTTRAPALSGLGGEAEYIAQRVRTSGPMDNPAYDELSGGIMPFWAADRISDEQLRDVVAFVESLDMSSGDGGVPTDGGMPSDGGSDGGASDDAGGGTDAGGGEVIDLGMGRDCGSSHSKVGQTATLSTDFHDVGGTAEIVDDCTIEIRDFTFDGGGIDVQIYGALGGDYNGGFSLSENLVGPAYDGDTLIVQLPEGQTLDDLDGISVWCVDVGVSFGDGMFSG